MIRKFAGSRKCRSHRHRQAFPPQKAEESCGHLLENRQRKKELEEKIKQADIQLNADPINSRGLGRTLAAMFFDDRACVLVLAKPDKLCMAQPIDLRFILQPFMA